MILPINLYILKLWHNIDSTFVAIAGYLSTSHLWGWCYCLYMVFYSHRIKLGHKNQYKRPYDQAFWFLYPSFFARWLIIFMNVRYIYMFKRQHCIWYTYAIVIVFRCFLVKLRIKQEMASCNLLTIYSSKTYECILYSIFFGATNSWI
jgi:hypothetical protein